MDLDLDMTVDPGVENFQEITSTPHEQFRESDNEKRWRLSYLKMQFECLELDKLFHRYSQRISHGYFSQYLSLQIILITSHFIMLFCCSDHPEEVIPDLILYSSISVISVILLIITDKYVKSHPSLLKYLAGTAFVITFFLNFFIPFYYKSDHLRPAYSTYIIISNYIFLNVHNNLVAFVIGLFVSICHLVTLILVTYYNDRNDNNFYARLGSDSIFLIAINGLGLYFRYMNEIVVRRSFLDRRSCIESTHQLKFEEEQENQLMSSIIPQHIIAIVRKAILDYWKSDNIQASNIPKQKPFEELYVEEHANVSILFADIVNYTAMTTKLDIIELLEVLNELFGRFDDASETLKVLRIKFLGDCYYCVAGLPPDPAPNHAEACVDLGLKMISIIADIRKRKNLDINMRIGIHSGKLSSGIIGTIKWQYDIWSTDVDIANKMETEGTPGMVHITSKTQQLLKKSYNISKTKKIVLNERTYLIAPNEENKTEVKPNGIIEDKIVTHKEITETNNTDNNNNQRRPTIYIKRNSTLPNDFKAMDSPESIHRSYSLISNYRALQENSENTENQKSGKRYTYPTSGERRYSGNPGIENFRRKSISNSRVSSDRRLTANDRKRRTAFMNNNIKRYKERLAKTNKELEETIENMLLSKFEQWFKINDMYRILLIFKNWKSELDFVKMPDPLFKYYFLNEILLVILVFILENLTLSTWDWPTWPYYLVIGVIFFACLPLCWTYHIWSKYIAEFDMAIPKNKIINFLTHTSQLVTNNVFIRVIIYTMLYALFCLCVLTEWLDCFDIEIFEKNNTAASYKQNFYQLLLRSTQSNISDDRCIIPWHMTETCGLAIIMSFLFLRMYMWLKLLYAFVIALIYSICILEYSGQFYGDSQTFNHGLDPKISHVASVMFLTLTLHLVDRQTEYMNRLDHMWYKNLIDKKEQANKMHKVNNMLLENILPLHVAELYLNVNRHSSEEVYHEHYDDAAVMFASLINFSVKDMGQTFLKVMHTIITEFDMLSVENTWTRPIEKIKIAKWTYMAACGLSPGFGNWDNMRKDQGEHVVISLLKFAASIMQKLKELNSESKQEIKLRIGISYGPIAAGVVGSKKPLYDIWGDPVNMASRMDTTGLPNHIQVLESTAEIIQRFGYKCDFRGETVVKGREHPVRTYFVVLDENFNLTKSYT